MLPEEAKDGLRGLVGLAEGTDAGLVQDLVLGQVDDLVRYVGVPDLAEGRSEVLDLDAKGVGYGGQVLLRSTQGGALHTDGLEQVFYLDLSH